MKRTKEKKTQRRVQYAIFMICDVSDTSSVMLYDGGSLNIALI